ncbi:hypothetical protein BDQ12DRAFT_613811 [Crucibulum laeve]|uniref:Frag1/DRAM/Sfk1 family-domain-containing protein n=1 Tax=Crucibulum laeve TaxID=68775 RepID=A0A5C3LNE8_9AGAR|nr:hypothetical protein BDQ12DRAFT_613811 [Crucibulum laeve]
MQLSLVSISLATVCVIGCLYGLFFVLFGASLYTLILRQRSFSTQPNMQQASSSLTLLILSSILIFMAITVHTIFVFVRLFQAFVWYKRGSAPLEFYADLSQPTEVAKTFIMVTAVVIADAMIIYRLWIIWSYSIAIILFPIFTLFGAVACGIGTTYQFTQYKPGENISTSQAGHWIMSLFVATLCTNIYSTVCIAGRIIKINRGSIIYEGGSLMSVVAIVIESAAIFTAWSIFGITSLLSKSNLQFITADLWSTISGISFMLINVRVGLGWAHSGKSQAMTQISLPELAGINPSQENTYSGGEDTMKNAFK